MTRSLSCRSLFCGRFGRASCWLYLLGLSALGVGCLVEAEGKLTSGVSLAGFPARHERSCERIEKIRGITLGIIEENRLKVAGYGSPQCMWAIEEAREIGAEWIALTPYATMMSCDDTQVYPYFEFPPERAREMLKSAIRQAKSQGMKVFLAPHLYPWDWCWRGNLRPGGGESGTPEGWEEWFVSYSSYMLKLAAMAAVERVDMLSLGVELKSATSGERGYDLAQLAHKLRRVFPGLLTYSANWDEVWDVKFWDELDYIGVNAFYPLSETGSEEDEEISRNLSRIAKEIESLSRLHRKPVIFTEIGFKALRGSLKEPWIWPEHVEAPVEDNELQARLFDLAFHAFWGMDWFAGLFVWRYMSDPSDYSQEPPSGFLPRLKPAESVISIWFACGR